jgi:hypothetical protein
MTIVKDGDKDSQNIICLYSQYDGYPSGHGKNLKTLIGHLQIVNGMSGTNPNIANGMGCLAVQLITFLKNDHYERSQQNLEWINKAHEEDGHKIAGDGYAGSYYLCPTDQGDKWDEYKYTVYFVKKDHEVLEQERREQNEAIRKAWDEAENDEARKKLNWERLERQIPIGTLCIMLEDYGGKLLYDGSFEDFDPDALEESDDE